MIYELVALNRIEVGDKAHPKGGHLKLGLRVSKGSN